MNKRKLSFPTKQYQDYLKNCQFMWKHYVAQIFIKISSG